MKVTYISKLFRLLLFTVMVLFLVSCGQGQNSSSLTISDLTGKDAISERKFSDINNDLKINEVEIDDNTEEKEESIEKVEESLHKDDPNDSETANSSKSTSADTVEDREESSSSNHNDSSEKKSQSQKEERSHPEEPRKKESDNQKDSNKSDKSNESTTPSEEDNNLPTVTLTVQGPKDIGTIIGEVTVEYADGDTVLDILLKEANKRNIHVDYSGRGVTAYVKGIYNVYEFDYGPLSGWLAYINGTSLTRSAGATSVKEGDKIYWKYTEDYTSES
ncbi:DUF4430 domain-containing protein [Evansella cellulosilytica]|uniref:Transcobalamin-like C-terminal domain-containing protein n=1 Tax=Evansella cellulosilytica (strain ATCC 21833 / DSM 2522 / FERM P-1141 / JCM 9156 / N-4) TaxID=649639 RepID=E6TX22_EVAC2|nr:DUF4430 domain-containing protein [Evansella cellulosilytica]ADU31111.1 hypothetical protein Bcell_2859 [Evansella cellulosilytica DSM 2522]